MSGPYDGYPHVPPFYQPHHGPPVSQSEGYVPGYPHYHGLSSEYFAPAYHQVDEYGGQLGPAQATARVRRRIGAAGEHVKHRRTRSGCYTCRNRRVKCDEARPTCERCRKGNRECVYPENNSTSKAKRRDSKGSKTSHGDSASSPSGDEYAESERKESAAEGLETIPDNEEGEEAPQSAIAPPTAESSRKASSTPSLSHGKSPTPSTEDSMSALNSAIEPLPPTHATASRLGPKKQPKPTLSQIQNKKWAELPPEVTFYLNYHRTHLTNYHYAFKYDHDDFLQKAFLDIAIRSEPLLYAVVGFAAYHYTVSKGEGKIKDFLTYYNKSVTLLRLALTKNPKPNIITLITILQLATIEEYLGDWVSLLSHQRAAYALFTSLYTPQTVMQTEMSRKLLSWYIRYDLMAGMMSGNGTFLELEWFTIRHDWFVQEVQRNPGNIDLLYKERYAVNGVICADAARLWSRKSKGQVSEEEFDRRSAELEADLMKWEERIHPMLRDRSQLIKDFSGAPPRDENDIIDPYEPDYMYGGALWSTNLMYLDWWAFELMFKHQLSVVRRQQPPENSRDLALNMLHMFEAIQLYPNKPAGITIAAQATIGVAGLFMPKDERHSFWVRKKLASVEALGYCYPKSFREKMTNHWGVDLSHWWLPNDEAFPPILRMIRSLIHDRSEGPQRDQISEDLRDMRGIFTSLSLDEAAVMGQSPISLVVSDDGNGKGKETATPTMGHSIPVAEGERPSPGGVGWPTAAGFMEVDDEELRYDENVEFSWAYGAPNEGSSGA